MSGGGARWNTGHTSVCRYDGTNYTPGQYGRHVGTLTHQRAMKARRKAAQAQAPRAPRASAGPKVIRVPARVYLYITGTGWYQGQDNAYILGLAKRDNPGTVVRDLTPLELADDAEDKELIRLIDTARTNRDGSLSVVIAGDWVLDRLDREGDYLYDTASHADNSPDDLGDMNAARAMRRRVAVAREQRGSI